LQDQAERMVNTVIDQATWLPEESRRVIDEMVGAYKKGRTDFKGAIDENFVKMADLFEAVPTLKKPQTSPMPKTK
ncbi:MAG: hypothetical protein WB818_19315, partial [Desulfobacterales bacterium]